MQHQAAGEEEPTTPMVDQSKDEVFEAIVPPVGENRSNDLPLCLMIKIFCVGGAPGCW